MKENGAVVAGNAAEVEATDDPTSPCVNESPAKQRPDPHYGAYTDLCAFLINKITDPADLHQLRL